MIIAIATALLNHDRTIRRLLVLVFIWLLGAIFILIIVAFFRLPRTEGLERPLLTLVSLRLVTFGALIGIGLIGTVRLLMLLALRLGLGLALLALGLGISGIRISCGLRIVRFIRLIGTLVRS